MAGEHLQRQQLVCMEPFAQLSGGDVIGWVCLHLGRPFGFRLVFFCSSHSCKREPRSGFRFTEVTMMLDRPAVTQLCHNWVPTSPCHNSCWDWPWNGPESGGLGSFGMPGSHSQSLVSLGTFRTPGRRGSSPGCVDSLGTFKTRRSSPLHVWLHWLILKTLLDTRLHPSSPGICIK